MKYYIMESLYIFVRSYNTLKSNTNMEYVAARVTGIFPNMENDSSIPSSYLFSIHVNVIKLTEKLTNIYH